MRGERLAARIVLVNVAGEFLYNRMIWLLGLKFICEEGIHLGWIDEWEAEKCA